MSTELAAPLAPIPTAVEPAPVIHATVDSWVAERRARREAAAPARGDGGKFVSKKVDIGEDPARAAHVDALAEQVDELIPVSDADTQAADDGQGEPLEANPGAEDAGPPEPLEAAIEPPQFWDAEGKERFAKLSPASQKEVVEYEKQRTAAVAKAMQKSTEAAKAAEAKHQQLREIVDRFGESEEPADARMKQWDEWFAREGVELARTNPAAFVAEQARYQAEKREVDQVRAAKAEAERALYSEHIKEQNRLLPELAPELADPKEGKQRFADTLNYARELGYDADQLRWITARDLSVAHKAMLWDRAQARAKEAPKPKPKPAGPNAAPAGQGQKASSSDAQLRALQSKKSLSQEEFMEMRRLQRK